MLARVRPIASCAVAAFCYVFSMPHEVLAQGAGPQAYVAAGAGSMADHGMPPRADGIAYLSGGAEYVGVSGVGCAAEWGRISGFHWGGAPTTVLTLQLVIAHQVAQSRATGFFHSGVGLFGRSVADNPYVFLFAGGIDTRLSRHTALRTGLTVIFGLPGGTGIVSAGIVFR
jgi:hypothetical protein